MQRFVKPQVNGRRRDRLVSAIVFGDKDGGWVELQPPAPPSLALAELARKLASGTAGITLIYR